MPTINLLCLSLTINKPKKKESSFNFVRLHPKPHIEPLVTPPASPLVCAPASAAPASPLSPKRCESPAPQLGSGASKFTERLELPLSFYETSFSESTAELGPQPLGLNSMGGIEEGSAECGESRHAMGVRREGQVDVHPYLRTSAYGVIEGSHREA